MTFFIQDSFPAAHRIRIDSLGTLEAVHVHHWRVKACLETSDAPEAVSVQARDLISAWVRQHRGRCLNDIEPFERVNPTAEEVARQLCAVLGRELPAARVRSVQIGEAAGFSATYWPAVS